MQTPAQGAGWRRILVTPCVILLFVAAILPVTARAGELAESVVRLSPLGEISRHYSSMVRQGLREGLMASGQVEPFLADSLAVLASGAFNGARMRSRLAADLSEKMSPDRLEEVQAWYRTPLGERLAAAEVAAARPEAWEAMSQAGAGRLEQARETDRVTLFRQYDTAVRVSDRAADIAEAAQRRLVPAYISVMGSRAPDAATLEKEISDHQPMVRAQIEQQAYMAFLGTYEAFSGAELRQYLEFLESDAGRDFTRIAGDTIGQNLLEPLDAVSSQIARLLSR